MAKKAKEANPLHDALAAVAVASNQQGLISESYARINPREIVSTDGVIAIGHPVQLGFVAFPNMHQLHTAVKACKGVPEITQDGETLLVKSGRFRAKIKCMPDDAITPVGPDLAICSIPDTIKEGLAFCGEICDDMSLHVMTSSVQFTTGLFRSTDRASFREYWHGLNFPDMSIPKACITALSKIKETPVGVGWSESSITFHYENGTWLKSLLMNQNWPDMKKDLFGDISAAKPLPEDFFEGVKAIAAFETKTLKLGPHGMEAGTGEIDYAVSIPENFTLSPERLLGVAPYAKHYCTGPNQSFVWLGDNRRGVISGMF